MSLPVDLSNLKEITDGDVEMERELFKEFMSSAEQYIYELSAILQENQNQSWRSLVHAFKGIALNLGANNLASLCKEAQDGCDACTDKKINMLNSIKHEYSKVRRFLLEQ